MSRIAGKKDGIRCTEGGKKLHSSEERGDPLQGTYPMEMKSHFEERSILP